MSNPLAPEFRVTLGGQERVLHFGMSDFCRAEIKLGRPIVSNGATEVQLFERMAIFLFVGLYGANRRLTLDDCVEMLNFDDVGALATLVKDVGDQIFKSIAPLIAGGGDQIPTSGGSGGSGTEPPADTISA